MATTISRPSLGLLSSPQFLSAIISISNTLQSLIPQGCRSMGRPLEKKILIRFPRIWRNTKFLYTTTTWCRFWVRGWGWFCREEAASLPPWVGYYRINGLSSPSFASCYFCYNLSVKYNSCQSRITLWFPRAPILLLPLHRGSRRIQEEEEKKRRGTQSGL